MLKKLFKDSSIYALASAITGGLTFLFIPFLSRKLSVQEYGVMDLLLSSFTIVNVLVSFDISQALARFYPSVSEDEYFKYASTGLWFTFLMYAAFLLITTIAIVPITEILIGEKAYAPIVQLSFVSMFAYGVFCYLLVQMRWALKPYNYALASILFIVFNVTLTYILISKFNMLVNGFFAARIIASIIGIIFCLYVSKRIYKFVFDIKVLKKMLTFSVPLAISSVGIFFSLYMDRFIIRATLSLTDLGIYSLCARTASIAGSIVVIMNFALTPLIYSTHNDPKTPRQIALLFEIIIYGMLALLLILLLFSKKILFLLGGQTYTQGEYLLPLLVGSFIVAGLYNFAPGLWIANKTIYIAIINISSALLNILLCLVLIPSLGYLGAGISTLFTSCIILIVSTIFSQKYYPISYDWRKISSAIGVTLLFVYYIVHS